MSEPEPVKQLGYKLVGDNIAKGVKTRFMRAESHRNQSLHYFHAFATKNRIDFSDSILTHVRTVPFTEHQVYCHRKRMIIS